MSVRQRGIELGIVVACVALAIFLATSPGPSRALVSDAKQVCGSIGPKASVSDVIDLVSKYKDRSVKVDKMDERLLLVRVSVCHCWVRFSDTGASTSDVLCHG